MEAAEKKAELIRCLQVLFEKLIEEKIIGHLATVLKKHGAISQGQAKKVNAECKNEQYGTALQKLVASLEKGELGKFESALEDEEFPAVAEEKMLLSLLVGVQDQNLILVIKNWDKLSQCEDELRHLIADGSGDGDWVKCLVLAAFEEILQKKKEKPILDSIKKAISNVEPVECSTGGSERVTHVKLKRSGPEGIAQLLQNTEENSSDEKSNPSPAKRSKILMQGKTELKRRQDDETSKLESKKFKTKDASAPKSSSSDTTPSNEEEISPGEKDKQSLPEVEEAKEPQDATGAATATESKSTPSGEKIVDLQDGNMEKTDDQTGSKNSGKKGKTKKGKKKKAEKSASGDKTEGDVDPGTSEESTQSNVDNKEEVSEGENTSFSSSSVIVISSDDDSCSSEGEGGSQGSTNAEQKGPTTRSQTAAKQNSQENKDFGDRRDSGGNKDSWVKKESTYEAYIIPLEKEVTIGYMEKDEHIMEIRAIVSDIKSLPTDTVLCIVCKETNWKPKEMEFNERKRHYFQQFLHNCSGNFQFKFCYLNKFSEKIEWEVLPGFGQPHTNRVIDLSEVETSWTFVLNVCHFKKIWNWDKQCCRIMGQFLPNSVPSSGQRSDYEMQTQTSPAIDLFCWVDCVAKGWQTNTLHDNCHKPKEAEFEEILLKWLDDHCSSQSDDVEGQFLQIQITLTLAVAFASVKHEIVRQALLVKMFQKLNLNGMDVESCEKLLTKAKKFFETNSEFGLKLPTYREAMNWLFQRIPAKPNFDWIFSLPLYWLLVHEKVEQEVLKPIAKRNFLYARSSLPSIAGFDWTSVWNRCQSVNRSLIEDLAPNILETAQLHPWIVGTFLYLLNHRELGKLILSRKESKIAMQFSIDSTLTHYLAGYIRKHYLSYTKEQHESCENFFCERLSEAIEHASEPEIPYEERERQLGVCVNLIGFVNQFLEPFLRLLGNADIDFCVRVIAQNTVDWASFLDMNEELKDFNENLNKMLDLVKKRISDRSKVDVKEIEHWNRLLEIDWNLDWLAKKWKEQIVNEITCAINNFWLNTRSAEVDGEKYLDFYVGEFSDMDLVPELDKCFDEIAFACTEKMLKKTEAGEKRSAFGTLASWVATSWTKAVGKSTSSNPKSRFITILETLFMKSFQKSTGGSEVTIALNFLCSWSFSAHFYELFGQELLESFSKEAKSIIKKVEQDFKKVVKSLDGAEITFEHLNIVLQKKEQFRSVWRVFNSDKKETASTSVDDRESRMLDKKIDLCENYLKTYKRTKSAIEDFIQVCYYVEYEEGEVIPHEELTSKVKCNVENYKVCDLVTGGTDDEPDCYEFFGITEEQLVEFQQISFIKDSKKIFREMFVCSVEEMKAEQEDELVPWSKFLQVFGDVKHQIFDLIEEIDSGTITMDAVIQRFKILDGKKDQIDCEIDLFYEFFTRYRHLEMEDDDSENEDARMLDSEIRKKQVFNSFELQSANEAVDVLLELRELLKLEGDFSVLTHRKEMVENQRTVLLHTVPEKLDIPQICSVDAEKLSILKKFMEERHIIKWLEEKTNGMQEVKVMCDLAMISAGENVVEVDRVSNLLSAVIGFEQLIFWEEGDRENAGSAELLARCEKVWANETKNLIEKWRETSQQLSCFKEVEQFYGSVEKSSLTRTQQINEGGAYTITSPQSNRPLTVENCIILAIQDKTQELGLAELHELQSKLMLIAGDAEKGQHDVNAFVAVLTSVQQLAEVYVKLVTSGCMLFAGWKAVVRCHGGDELNIEIRFIDDAPPMIGNGKHTELDKLTEMLKTSHAKWEDHVASKRVEFYNLNEYNIQQIMYLCHELASLDNLEEIPSQVRSLLSFVTKDFDIDDLKECLDSARKANDEMDVDTRERPPATGGFDTMNDQSLGPQEDDTNLTQEEREVDYSENFLKDVILKLHKDAQQAEGETFLESVNTICAGYLDEPIALNLRDHLSLELLGKFLSHLNLERGVHRKLLPGLLQGSPNLLICSEDEILPTVLSLYMHDVDQTLPSHSEVLICNNTTTIEEVEMFFRRAMYDSGNGDRLVYALAFADKLTYAASSKVEDVFNKLIKSGKINQDYQLVILLSKQQHYLTNCFDKYIVDGRWSRSTKEIQSYLKRHLKVDHFEKTSAASVSEGKYMVKVITATRSGVGKSLYVQRLKEELEQRVDIDSLNVTIRLLENKLDTDFVIKKLNETGCGIRSKNALLVHVDLTPAVQHGIELFAFNLFLLGIIQGSDGKVWKTHQNHFYAVEMTDFGNDGQKRFSSRHILNLLPCVTCRSPREVLNSTSPSTGEVLGMDSLEFLSETFQRPLQYLMRLENDEELDEFKYKHGLPAGTPEQCIEVLLHHCCIEDPSWAQLRHFCNFLNVQLKNCEKYVFCTSPTIKLHLKVFAVKFVIRMAQDFATPSLQSSDVSMRDSQTIPHDGKRGFSSHQIRRKWEETSHPCVFFNEDGQAMTFINVRIDQDGYLVDQNGEPTEKIATPELVAALKRQGFDLGRNFEEHPRAEKLRFLRQVLGIQEVFDPDPTYELTTDNVLKILAIYMRFRCQIPVIIMGETGCGKTRLVEFMSKLKAGNKPVQENLGISDKAKAGLKNMITLKIHGGVTVGDIHQCVEEAIITERQNRKNGEDFTVLFFDEVNTTEAIYAIKEVMCDKSIDGKSFRDSNLQIVAACNPYKKLSDEAIKKLEDSGLGYRIRTSEPTHLFGNIPVRSLVYRVVPLPPSMQPFVWDFGQLGDEAEKIYIQQMTRKLAQKIGLSQRAIAMINDVLSNCQKFMSTRKDECRYVSLRDVERCMTVYEWFYKRQSMIHDYVVKEVADRCEEFRAEGPEITPDLRTLIQTVGVCYHASLDDRKPLRSQLAKCLNLPGIDERYIEIELVSCQAAFLRNVRIEDNIACNEALRENVFMMVVCADMKIPLFLIGKPGSSKSLAKTIVSNNMQGQASHALLYRKLKQIHILSYQCSALTDAEGIERVFSQCSQLQKNQNPDTYTAVVVLDEIGLAEDSPNMPLKVLHPLLERRSTEPDRDKGRAGFVGISNWALDPAKMNRGIFLTRNKPTEKDLKKTGKEIGRARIGIWKTNLDLFEMLTREYLKIYMEQDVEYFGLRDYYSLVKLICSRCSSSDVRVKFTEVVYAILRNFSGGEVSVVENLLERVRETLQVNEYEPTPAIPIQHMIEHNLRETDSRFLLLLVNQFSVVSLLQSCIEDSMQGAQVIFGSSFPGDHCYTEVCRNINRIKVCMETGKTVILLNMANIHESLYHALNQRFVIFRGLNYVDVGLGGHKVKCLIANKFRLIVIEKKDVVCQEYPIPLINRLEKHHFNSDSLLSREQRDESRKLKSWASNFIQNNFSFTCQHAFVGFHDDTISSIVLTTEGDLEDYKSALLQCCSVDAILRLPDSNLHENEIKSLQDIYFSEQHHDTLADVLRIEISRKNQFSVLEITSFSDVLSEKGVDALHSELDLPERSIVLLSLEQFHTQDEYSKRLSKLIERYFHQEVTTSAPLVLLIQCAQAQSQTSLIACAQHTLMNKIREVRQQIRKTGTEVNATVALLLSAEREGGKRSKMDALVLQPSRETKIIHVDEMRSSNDHIARVSNFMGKSLCGVFDAGRQELESGKCSESLINIGSLLVDCICESVARVKDQTKENGRHLKRVQILINLCSNDDIAGTHFRKILLKKIVEVYSKVEEANDCTIDWVFEKANDRERLQEGGTFRKTLWLCLKEHVSRFLSYIVSVVDRCNNLDFIAKDPLVSWELNMWLGTFEQLEISWRDITYSKNHQNLCKNQRYLCKLPFSFLIIGFLQTQWNALKTHRIEDVQESFIRLFQEFRMKKIINNALEIAKIDFMKNFVSDLIGSMYRPGTNDVEEISIVEKVVFDFAMENFKQVRQKKYFRNGDEIAIIFLTLKTLFEKLEKFSEVLQGCPQVLKNWTSWIEKQKDSTDFVLHVFAFKGVLNLLKEIAERIQEPKACLEWIELARFVKNMFDSVTNIISDEEDLKSLKTDWIALSLLDMLLLQLLPPAHSDGALFQNFVRVIAPHAKLFWKGSVGVDVRSYNFLRIVLTVLKRCYADVSLRLLVNWDNLRCRICRKKVEKPTFLPCGHLGCEKCILQHVRSNARCMTCNTQFPENCIPVLANLDKTGNKILGKMKLNCTSFFLEYLQKFCFKNIAGVLSRMEQQVEQILKKLVVQSPDEDDRQELDSTSLDLNVNTKSSILQTLLQHNRTHVLNELNHWLRVTDGETKNSLVTVILKTYEHRSLMSSWRFEEDREKTTKFWRDLLGNAWHGILLVEDQPLEVDILQKISELRCALIHFILLVNESLQGIQFSGDAKIQIDSFVCFCTDLLRSRSMPQAVKDFVLKSGCHKFGKQWLYQLTEDANFKVLILPAIQQATVNCNTDHWVLLGEQYTRTKSELYRIEEEGCTEEMASILNSATENLLPYFLAMTSWCDKEVKKDKIADIYKQHGAENNIVMRFLLERKDDFKCLLASHAMTSQQADILYQLVTIVIAATTVQNDIMKSFYDVINDPRLVRNAFLPAMPEDMYFATPAEYRSQVLAQTSMYMCPKGHLYSMGPCARPFGIIAKCPECLSTIGGRNYKSAPGNELVSKNPESQAGYKTEQGGNVSAGAERMSPQGAAVCQFLLHSCLLAASMNHGGTVASILQCSDVSEAKRFLVQQLQVNLQDLSTALSRNADDTILVLYRILLRIMRQGPKAHRESWTTLDDRKAWEQRFRVDYLLPVFQSLEREIAEARTIMREAEEAGSPPLTRLIHEIQKDEQPVPAISWDQQSLWNIIEHPNSSHLLQFLEDQMEERTGEVLQIILQTPELRFVKFLENILKLQQKMIRRYQYQIDMKEGDQRTLRDHIENGGHHDENAIREYISAWNEVYKNLQHVAPDYLSKYFGPICLDSPLSMILPSMRGRGQCAKILTEYLIDMQNQFLTRCVQVIKPAQRLKEVEIQSLTSVDFVCMEKQKDLRSLINMHTNYTITYEQQERRHIISYNIDALEKQVREEFVMSKKLIKKNTIPCMKYPQDIGIGSDWKNVASTINQEPLTTKLTQDIDRIVKKSHSSDLCEGVRTLTIAISFLAMVKVDLSKLLCEFMEEDLQLPSSRTLIIPRSAQISYVLSIYQRLTWRKSVMFVRRGLDPYKEALAGTQQEQISEETLVDTLEALKHIDVAVLQQRMNEMLITGTGIENPDWTLTEDVFPYLQFLDKSEDDSWYSNLPVELCNKHLGDLFKLSVEETNKN